MTNRKLFVQKQDVVVVKEHKNPPPAVVLILFFQRRTGSPSDPVMLVLLALAPNRKWTPKVSDCITGERHRGNWNPFHLPVGRSDPAEQRWADTQPETPELDQR